MFTQDITKAMRAARELEFGGVTLNEAPTYRADQMPYGGVKESGNTREGPKFAVQEMTEPRMIVISLYTGETPRHGVVTGRTAARAQIGVKHRFRPRHGFVTAP